MLLKTLFITVCLTQAVIAGPKLGFGISLPGFTIIQTSSTSTTQHPNITPASITSIYGLYNDDNFRLEPHFSISTTSESDEEEPDEKYNSSILGIGIGAFYQKSINNFSQYFGLRVGILSLNIDQQESYTSFGSTSSYNRKQTIYFLAPTMGSEYIWADHFSIGAEIRFEYDNYGKSVTTIEDKSNEGTLNQSNFYTAGLLFIRWYL